MGFPLGLPEQTAKAARIGEPNCLAGIQNKVHMVVSPSWKILGHHPQTARHTQVQKGTAGGYIQQEIFGAAAHS